MNVYKIPHTDLKVSRIAYGCMGIGGRWNIVLTWLLRHPAGIQPIVGTTKPERVAASCLADNVELSREEWYQLFSAARGAPLS